MLRILSLVVVTLLMLAPDLSSAAARKRQPAHWHGYGFLPGYHQPPNVHVPVFGEKGAARSTPYDAPEYYWNGEWRYFGRPGFYRGRYNGGSFGPCWTWTPIGPAWNCG